VVLTEYMNAGEIKKLAALTGLPIPTRKADLVDLIVRYLDDDGLRAVWQALDELQRAAVAEVVHGSRAYFAADRFRAKYDCDPAWGSLDEYRRDAYPTALCFFFYGYDEGGGIPPDLRERLKAFVPTPTKAKVKTIDALPPAYDRPYERWNHQQKIREKGTEAVPLTVRDSERSAQRELLSTLRLVDAGKIAVSVKTRRASASTIEAITAVLEGGDYYPHVPPKDKWHDENAGPIRAFAWPLLIQAGGLAQLSGTRLQLTKGGRKALFEPASETLRALWTKWMNATLLDELSRIDCVKGQTGKGKHGLTALSSRRGAIADALAECPVGSWIATEEFFRFMRASDNDFAVTRNAWNLYIAELQYGALGYGDGERILDERYLLCLLLEYAATLGLIDVALIPPVGARRDYHGLWGTDDLLYFSRYDGLMYFRLNALGAYCLGVAPVYVPGTVEVKPVLRVLSNLEIAAIGAILEQGDRLALDAYATRVSDLVWRIEAGKLLSASGEGRSVEEIREFLLARSASPLPATVSRLLADVADRGARVQDCGLARLIECAEPALAALIANDTRTRKHCMRAGERHLVVPVASEVAFRRALRDVGYLLASGKTQLTKGRRDRGSEGLGSTGN
ncbi:MAG: hypothetical protein ACREJ4_02455, partial [Candidatus Methylomirabilaceae bacterium]